MPAPTNPQTPREFLHAWLEGAKIQYRYTVPPGQEKDIWRDMLNSKDYLEIPTLFIPQDKYVVEFRIVSKESYVVIGINQSGKTIFFAKIHSSYVEASKYLASLGKLENSSYTIHKLSEPIIPQE